MPGLTGREALERVVEFDPAIDVILMTAHYTSESAVETIQKGAADYLDKPVSISLVRVLAWQFLSARRRSVSFAASNWADG